jgi:hypothetical protein
MTLFTDPRRNRGQYIRWSALVAVILAVALLLQSVAAAPMHLMAEEPQADLSAGPELLAQADFRPQPASTTVNTGAQFHIALYIYAGSNQVSAADARLNFDSTYLSLRMAPQLGSGMNQVAAANYDNAAGTIDIGFSKTGTPATGTFHYATLYFQAKSLMTPAAGTLLTARSVLAAAPGGVALTSSWQNATVHIQTPPTPTITLTPSITPTPSLTPTPTATATPVPGSICISVYDDLDGDGVRDAGEPLLDGATVTVKRTDGTIVQQITTDGVTDPYCFDLPPYELYMIIVESPPGYDASGPGAAYIYPVSDVSIDIDFGQRSVTVTPTPTIEPTSTVEPTPPALYVPLVLRDHTVSNMQAPRSQSNSNSN